MSTCALGKISQYHTPYSPDLLFAISRQPKREELSIPLDILPFYGWDSWNHYEVSWLNQKGKPIVAVAELIYDCHSPFMIESKSMKLYFNSLNALAFDHMDTVKNVIQQDLQAKVGMPVNVKLTLLNQVTKSMQTVFHGVCLDDLDVDCSIYTVHPDFLVTENQETEETLYSDLLKSNCLVTHQPDWASVQIQYRGRKIAHEGLLKYLVSYRNHNEFHEQCIERIFIDIMRQCKPHTLTVYGRFTRRGGIDINPYRSTHKGECAVNHLRLYRQ